MRDPGLRWVVSPATDWKPSPPDAWHWAAYVPWWHAEPGVVSRFHGFAPTETEARTAALEEWDRYWTAKEAD